MEKGKPRSPSKIQLISEKKKKLQMKVLPDSILHKIKQPSCPYISKIVNDYI
jgi:hypothetical protein